MLAILGSVEVERRQSLEALVSPELHKLAAGLRGHPVQQNDSAARDLSGEALLEAGEHDRIGFQADDVKALPQVILDVVAIACPEIDDELWVDLLHPGMPHCAAVRRAGHPTRRLIHAGHGRRHTRP